MRTRRCGGDYGAISGGDGDRNGDKLRQNQPMSDDIDIGVAYTVQDLANELRVYRWAVESNRDVIPWPRFVWGLWSKTFVRSSGLERKSAPMPTDLVEQVTGLDPFRAVVVIVGRARAAVSGRAADLEIASVEHHALRFLETPEGKIRQKYLDEHPTP